MTTLRPLSGHHDHDHSQATLLSFCPVEYLELLDCECVDKDSIIAVLSKLGRQDLEVLYRRGGAFRTMHC